MGVVRESLEFRTEEAEASARSFGASLSAAAETADNFGNRTAKLAQGLGVLSPEAQMAAMAIADLADGASLLGTSAGVAMVGVAGIGVATIGATALVAGLVLGILDLTEASAEAIPELLELQEAAGVELVPDDTRERIERAAGAMGAMRSASSAAGAAIADTFSPAVEEAATLGVQLALAVRDITVRSADMGMAMVDVGLAMLDGFTVPLAGAVGGVAALMLVAAKAAEVVGNDGLAAELRTAGEAALAFASEGSVTGGLERLKTALASYRDEAVALVGAQVEINAAGRETTTTTTAAAVATDDLATGVDAAIGKLGGLFDTTEQAVEEANAAVDDIIAAVNAVPDSVAAAQDRIASLKGAAQGLGIAADVAQGGLSAGLGVVSQAGPVGAIIAAVIQIVQGIQSGMLQDMHGEVMGLFEGLPDMPAMIGDFIESSITEGIPALAEGVGGFIAALPDMLWQILKASTVGLAQAMYDALKSLFDGLFGERTERTEGGRAGSAAHDRGSAAAREAAAGGSTARSSAGAMGDRASGGALYGVMDPREMLGSMLMPALNRADRRDNLTSSGGVRYGVAGPVRVM